MTRAATAETMWVRERVTEILQARGLDVVVESIGRADGWRGEFLRTDDEEGDLVMTAHKPDDAPYVSLGVFVDLDPPERVSDWAALVDCVSDFEVSFWFRDEGPACVLTSRVFPLMASDEAFAFQLGNLLACRDAVRGLDDENVDVDADVRDSRETGESK